MADFVAEILAQLDTSKIEGQINEIEAIPIKFQNVSVSTKDIVSQIQQELNKQKLSFNFDPSTTQSFTKDAQSQGAKAGASFAKGFSKSAEKIQLDISNGKTDASLAKLEARLTKLKVNTGKGNDFSNLDNQLAEAKKLNETLKSGNATDLVASYNELYGVFAKLGNGMTVAEAGLKDYSSEIDKLNPKIKKLKADMESWLKANPKANNTFGEQIGVIFSNLNDNPSAEGLAKARTELAKIKSEAKAAGLTTSSFAKSLKDAALQAVGLNSAYDVFQKAVEVGKKMYQNVVDIDTAMTELKKVTDESSASYSRYLSSAGQAASQIGTTISDYVTSTADFARLGYSFTESQDLAKVASIYNVVGDDLSGIEEASQSIISTLKAFNIQANDSISIVDKFNEVSNNFAISSGGIGDALQRSASSFAAANNDINQSIALITAAKILAGKMETYFQRTYLIALIA